MIPGYDEWKTTPPEEEHGLVIEALRGPGRESTDSNIFVPEENAYSYALERISQDDELRQEFVEWFYSGNWIKED